MEVGVLALQGDFEEHISVLGKLGVESVEVRNKTDLDNVDGLIIPGGESTTISKLLIRYGLFDEIVERNKKGMSIYGTCAGAIVLAKEVIENNLKTLGLVDISIKRNDYGRQIDSFEAKLKIKNIGQVNGIFIRAPVVKKLNNEIEVLSEYKGDVVALRDGNILITTFHPELSEDYSVHRYFVDMIKG